MVRRAKKSEQRAASSAERALPTRAEVFEQKRAELACRNSIEGRAAAKKAREAAKAKAKADTADSDSNMHAREDAKQAKQAGVPMTLKQMKDEARAQLDKKQAKADKKKAKAAREAQV